MANQEAQGRHTRLCKDIACEVEANGRAYDGRIWAAQPLSFWADKLGVSERTIKRDITKPPIHKDCGRINGRSCLLLRVGPPEPPTPYKLAKQMKAVMQRQAKRQPEPYDWRPSQHDWHCLHGLAMDLPDGHELEIFRHTIKPDNWKAFMLHAKTEMIEFKTKGKPFFKLKPGAELRFYKFPSIPILRRYHEIAADLWREAQYETG